MNLFAALLLGHLIGDFPLQTNRIAQSKHESQGILLLHVLIHIWVTAALIENPWENAPLLILIGCSHYLIDLAKAHVESSCSSRDFLFDQITHISSLSIITMIAVYAPATLPANTLPATVLYPALGYALLLGSMVFGWVWANESAITQSGSIRQIAWMKSRMLTLSQHGGVALLGVIVVALFSH